MTQHDHRLQTLEKCRQAGITLNFDKCSFRQTSIMFIGEKISANGIEADPDKVREIRDWEPPHDVQSLQSFFGMLNFVGKFIPNMATRTSAMRSLLRKGSIWLWDENHEVEFLDMKRALTTHPVLAYYDPSKQHKISSDASKDGIGSVLLQMESDGWHPIHYGARSFSKTERSYAPIEREALGMLFGAIKFHQYVFGKSFILEIDHRPLVNIFQGYLNEAPARIQYIMLKLQKYDFQIVWVSRKFIMLADSLSKKVTDHTDNEIAGQIEQYVNEVKLLVTVSENMWTKFAQETDKDQELRRLRTSIQNGKIPRHYGGIRDKLQVLDNVIFKSNRILVPTTMRLDMIYRAHEGHLGAEKSKRRARQCLYWPGMSKDIDDYIAQCSTCCKFQTK